jgi:hypothetical protein
MTARLAARLRIPVTEAGIVLVIAGALVGQVPVLVARLVTWIAGVALYLRLGTVRAEPEPLRLPVQGRWWALNSPADGVPSHSSSEPHVHLQVMDRPRPLFAAGLPFVFVGATDDDGAPVDVPPAGTAVHG